MTQSLFKSRIMAFFATIGYLVFAVPVAIVIILAIWLTAAAAYENVKFVRSADQLLNIIGTVRKDAEDDADMGARAGEDIIVDLYRRAQIPGQQLVNNWGGGVRAFTEAPAVMRVETDVPVHACRRMAMYFGKDINILRLARIEAHQEKADWMVIYDSTHPSADYDSRQINAACGNGSYSTFALVLRLR